MSLQSFALRCRWHVRALERNALVRTSDRLEALSILALLALTVLAMPFAAKVGEQTHDTTLRIVHEEAQSRHSVNAVVVRGSTGLPTDFDTVPFVDVEWRDGARQRIEQVVSSGTSATGDVMTIWLDPTGRIVNAPLTEQDAAVNAASIGWTVWLLVAVSCGLVGLGVRKWLDRSRANGWERALLLLAHNDDGWANRRA